MSSVHLLFQNVGGGCVCQQLALLCIPPPPHCLRVQELAEVMVPTYRKALLGGRQPTSPGLSEGGEDFLFHQVGGSNVGLLGLWLGVICGLVF